MNTVNRLVAAGLFWALLATPNAYADDPISEGKALFQVRCTEMCHQTPRADHLTAKQWKVVLNTMQTRMRQFGMAPMSEREFELILQYVSAGAKK